MLFAIPVKRFSGPLAWPDMEPLSNRSLPGPRGRIGRPAYLCTGTGTHFTRANLVPDSRSNLELVSRISEASRASPPRLPNPAYDGLAIQLRERDILSLPGITPNQAPLACYPFAAALIRSPATPRPSNQLPSANKRSPTPTQHKARVIPIQSARADTHCGKIQR